REPVHRRYHQGEATFSLIYAFHEHFVLVLSHDEVVHGKGSMVNKMPGDAWQKFANLRMFYAWMYAHPGKKLLFMGGEFGQWNEWNHDVSLDWHLLRDGAAHGQLQLLVDELNRLYRVEPSLHRRDADPRGFEWVAADDVENSVYAFLRKGDEKDPPILCLYNCTPIPRFNYRIG